MCKRFAIEPVNVTGASSDLDFESAGRYIGQASSHMPNGATSPVGHWRVADIAVELSELTVRCPTDQPDPSVLTLVVEAL